MKKIPTIKAEPASKEVYEYINSIYELRDYIAFFSKNRNEKSNIRIIFNEDNLSYGRMISNEYKEFKKIKCSPTSLNLIISLIEDINENFERKENKYNSLFLENHVSYQIENTEIIIINKFEENKRKENFFDDLVDFLNDQGVFRNK